MKKKRASSNPGIIANRRGINSSVVRRYPEPQLTSQSRPSLGTFEMLQRGLPGWIWVIGKGKARRLVFLRIGFLFDLNFVRKEYAMAKQLRTFELGGA